MRSNILAATLAGLLFSGPQIAGGASVKSLGSELLGYMPIPVGSRDRGSGGPHNGGKRGTVAQAKRNAIKARNVRRHRARINAKRSGA